MAEGGRPFLTAEWRHLVMLQYEVPQALLAPSVPRGTTLDLWQGRALVSLVGFRFLRTRIFGIAIPFHTDFDEVNLRFYVSREGPEGPRRAVVFLREVVPRTAIAVIARLAYNEPYMACPMRHDVQVGESSGRARYEWKDRGRWLAMEATTSGTSQPSLPGSEEEFITEHYWGYTPQRDGGTLEYQVTHPRWRVWRTVAAGATGDLAGMYGNGFGSALSQPPVSAFVADGSAVAVHPGRRIA
jgi:uncharacterized protein YqjF (DUF2071 family)